MSNACTLSGGEVSRIPSKCSAIKARVGSPASSSIRNTNGKFIGTLQRSHAIDV
jgi:hypothetical protein